MIAVLPILLYPVAGIGLIQMAKGFLGKSSVIEVHGFDNLPKPAPFPVASLSALTPPPPGACCLSASNGLAGAIALYEPAGGASLYYPPLFSIEGDTLLPDSDRLLREGR